MSATVGKREATKQANRQAILDAARDVFAELGFGAASVRDVVRRTDLASGTFYNYFADKEAVLAALLDDAAGEARARIREARAAATSLEDFVRAGYEAYFTFLLEDRRTFELLRRNAGTIRAMFETPAMGAGFDELEADLRAGIAAGVLPEHDVVYMAAAMTGAGFEVGVRMLERDGDVGPAVDFIAAVFTAGLQAAAHG
jgi:AcrR family transcriptional regulator